MARPRCEDKHYAILKAAIQVIAVDGLGAPTAKIAKQVGVAEGTLFRYFATKDVLLNELYAYIKYCVSEHIKAQYDSETVLKQRVQSVWDAYIDWGLAHPDASKTLSQLVTSDKITAETKVKVHNYFADINACPCDMRSGDEVLAHNDSMFGSALFMAIAEVTMNFALNEPSQTSAYKASGFNVMWRGLTQE